MSDTISHNAIDYRTLTDAEPTSRAIPAPDEDSSEWVSLGERISDGATVRIYWIFTASDIEAAGTEASDLPWDSRIDRVETI